MRFRPYLTVFLCWAVAGIHAASRPQVGDCWPDGTPISSWFTDTSRVDVSTLGTRYVLTECGVAADSTLLQTAAIQAVIDRASASGGGVIVVPRGTFLSGALFFKQGTHLHIEAGGKLKGIDAIKHYPLLKTRIEGQTRDYFAALVNADSVDHFTISGPGTIDGNGLRFWEEFWIRRRFNPECTNLEALRPRLVYLSHCNDVQVQDVHLINSGFWTNHLYRCRRVKYIGCTIYAPHEPAESKAPSSDALDIDVCTDVLVHGCRISVNDDAVVIKGGKGTWADRQPENGPTENVIVQQCHYGFVHGCLTLGSESLHDRNIILRDCHVENASRVLWLKMRPDTPQHYEQLRVERITGSCGSFLFVRPWTQFFQPSERADMPLSECHDITIRDIQMRCRRFLDVGTSDKYRLHHFTFEDIDVEDERGEFNTDVIEAAQVRGVNVHKPQTASTAKAGTRWWWMGSAVDEENLRWSLEQYAAKGIGTVEITPIYGVQGNEERNVSFLSQRWMDLLRYCIEEGNRLGVQVDMSCGTGWPFGGPEVSQEEAACKLVVVDTVVNKKVAARLQLEAPPAERATARRILQRVFPTADRSRRRVIALFESRTRQRVKRAAPGGEGWVIDHFDSTAVAHYLQRIDAAFAETGTPWPATFFNDSYEVYGADWTPSLLEEFARRRGYRLEDRLPAFLDGDADVVSDYRETLGELLLQNFTEQWTRWAHSHGVKVRNQAHGSPANLIDVYAAVDIPEIEGFGLTDFGIKGLRKDAGMTRKNDSDFSMLKYASSAAHITGKPLTSAETFTWLTEHFRTSLSQMKPDLDLMFCAGVNRMLFHGTCFSPKDEAWPGWQFYASVDMSPTNSIWRDAGYLMQYIERCQQFLQWGQPDNDFLVYLPVRDMWHQNTGQRLMQFDIHSMATKAADFIRAILYIDSLGYDSDYISERYLLTTTFDGERLRTAAGTPYRALIIPGNCLLSESVKQHLQALEAQGARVIRDLSAAALQEAARPEAMKTELGLKMIRRVSPSGLSPSSRLPGSASFPSGLASSPSGSASFPLGSVSFPSGKPTGTNYHYFIANLSPHDVDATVPLAVPFSSAIWINPMADAQPQVAEVQDGRLRVRLRSGESRLLVTSPDSLFSRRWCSPDASFSQRCCSPDSLLSRRLCSPDSLLSSRLCSPDSLFSRRWCSPDSLFSRRWCPSVSPTGSPLPSDTLPLSRGWHLSFLDSTPTVVQTFDIDTLRTWEGLNAQTAELMGTGVYECTFTIIVDELTSKHVDKLADEISNSSTARINNLSTNTQLDLGDVRESARVYINGTDIGCAWAVPYILDIPQGVLRTGDNHLRIEITNLPANRIAALDRQGVPWRKFEDINVVDVNYRRTTYAAWAPVPSGLKGPVCLISSPTLKKDNP